MSQSHRISNEGLLNRNKEISLVEFFLMEKSSKMNVPATLQWRQEDHLPLRILHPRQDRKKLAVVLLAVQNCLLCTSSLWWWRGS